MANCLCSSWPLWSMKLCGGVQIVCVDLRVSSMHIIALHYCARARAFVRSWCMCMCVCDLYFHCRGKKWETLVSSHHFHYESQAIITFHSRPNGTQTHWSNWHIELYSTNQNFIIQTWQHQKRSNITNADRTHKRWNPVGKWLRRRVVIDDNNINRNRHHLQQQQCRSRRRQQQQQQEQHAG